MMKYIGYVFLLSLILTACSKTENLVETPDSDILGIWVKNNDINNERIKIFIRKDSFDTYKFGYAFNENNKCTIRIKVQCGEVPIYENVEANYTLTGDTLINIKYFYNRKTEYSLLIKTLTPDSLILSNL